ncbi:hypothetical protein TNCV_4375421 [Trichonephila clavipes]|uniref:Uncharacterized protein n=1 Tax=Trichonephila clavipes TaxID=2585209 RepID=A0A8X6W2P0_TRICX|nr:hypothetical protein TNCV_4375421 [Trichonephila clavipes]
MLTLAWYRTMDGGCQLKRYPHYLTNAVVVLFFVKGMKESCQNLKQVGLPDFLLSMAVAFSTMQVTLRLRSVPLPIKRENILEGYGYPTSLPFPPTSRKDLALGSYLEYPLAAKALYI